MCPHDRYALFVSSRGTGVSTITANSEWQVVLPPDLIIMAASRSAQVTVRGGLVTYPQIVTTVGAPLPDPGFIKDISVYAWLGASGASLETSGASGDPHALQRLFTMDLGHLPYREADWVGTFTTPARTMSALGEPTFYLPSLSGNTLRFSRQWVYDNGVDATSALVTGDTGRAYVSFTLDFEFN